MSGLDEESENNIAVPFSETLQEEFICRFCRQHDFCSSFLDIIDNRVFSNAYYQIVVLICTNYVRAYRRLPKTAHLLEECKSYCQKDPRLQPKEFAILLKKIHTFPINDKESSDYLQDKFFLFLQRTEIEKSLVKSIGMLSDPDLDEKERIDNVRKIVNRSLSLSRNKPIVIDHRKSLVDRIYKVKENTEKGIPTVFCPDLDRRLDGGAKKNEMLTVIAPTGRGKTMFLVNFMRGGLLMGKNVLYLTLETAADIINLRLDQSMSNMSRDQIRLDPDYAISAVKRHYERYGGRAITVEYPAYSADIETIYFLLDDLYVKEDFVPDAIIVDYPDLLKASSNGRFNEHRHQLTHLYTEVRGIGAKSRYDCSMITVSQSNRSSFNSDIINLEHVAEDIGKVQCSDIILTLCQSKEQKEQKPPMMGIFIAKNRNNPAGDIIPVHVDPEKMLIYSPTAPLINPKTNSKK